MLAVDKGTRGDPQHSILGDNLRHHPYCPCTLTPPYRTVAGSHGHPHVSQPGNSHSWLLLPTAFPLPAPGSLVSGSDAPLSSPWLHPVLQDLSYRFPAAWGAPEMLALWEGRALVFPAYSVIPAPCPVPGAREGLGECEVMDELKKDMNIPNLRQEELRTQACQR